MELSQLVKAADFAAKKHVKQVRKGDSSPYINHPIGVANYISQLGGVSDLNTLIAAILHDTVEDTGTSFEEIETEFGVDVANIVREVTDDKSLPKHERKKQQIIHAAHASTQAKLVKLADKYYNLLDIQRIHPKGWDQKRIQGYCVWAKAVVDVIRGTNKNLEDALDAFFASTINTAEFGSFPAIPQDTDLAVFLQEYYEHIL